MLPVLFTAFGIPVSSFGVFLALGFLLGVFLIWRLARAWELDEEKILDLTILTFLGGLFGARIYYVITNLELFSVNFLNIFQINKVPGFSFWGAILGGWLTLYFLARKKKQSFWLIADVASVGFLGSLILSSLGCFLGGCDAGIKSNFLAVNMVGILGKRLPIQLIEAALLSFVLLRIWSQAVHFHPRGKILSLALIYIGLIKLITEPLKANHNEGIILSMVLIFLGITLFHKINKGSLLADLKGLSLKIVFDRLNKSWYNLSTVIFWKARKLKKTLGRLHVRFSYKNN